MITLCRNCVFAEYDGTTQTDDGCALGRITKFEAQGAKVVGMDDGELRFLTIDRLCSACHDSKSPYLKGATQEEWRRSIRDFLRPRIAYVVIASGDLSATLDSIAAQAVPPSRVVIVFDEGGLKPSTILRALRGSGLTCPYEVVQAIECPEQEQATYNGNRTSRLVDLGVEKLDPKGDTYYAVVERGQEVPGNFSSVIDKAVNEDMRSVSAVISARGGVYAIQTLLHLHEWVCGNRGIPLLEKLPDILRDHPDHILAHTLESLQ